MLEQTIEQSFQRVWQTFQEMSKETNAKIQATI